MMLATMGAITMTRAELNELAPLHFSVSQQHVSTLSAVVHCTILQAVFVHDLATVVLSPDVVVTFEQYAVLLQVLVLSVTTSQSVH